MSTMAFGSLYPGRPSQQEARSPSNSVGTAKTPGARDFNIPVLPGVAGYLNISLPTLFVLGALAWFLIEKYD